MEEMRGRIEIARDAEEEEEEGRRPHVDEQRRDDMYESACEGDEKGVAWREGRGFDWLERPEYEETPRREDGARPVRVDWTIVVACAGRHRRAPRPDAPSHAGVFGISAGRSNVSRA
jgi:hypothetical protein